MRIKVQLVKHDKPPAHFHKVQYLQLPYSAFKFYIEALHKHLVNEDAQRTAAQELEKRALKLNKATLAPDAAVQIARQSVLALEADESILWTNQSARRSMQATVVDMGFTADLARDAHMNLLDDFGESVKKTLHTFQSKVNSVHKIEYPFRVALTPRRILVATATGVQSVWFRDYQKIVVHDYREPEVTEKVPVPDTDDKVFIECHKSVHADERTGVSIKVQLTPDNFSYVSTRSVRMLGVSVSCCFCKSSHKMRLHEMKAIPCLLCNLTH